MLTFPSWMETDHHCCCCNRHNVTSNNFVNLLSAEVKLILRELRSFSRKMKDREEEDLVVSDWKFAAMVIDRFCLIGLSLYTLLTTVVLFLSAPHLIVT